MQPAALATERAHRVGGDLPALGKARGLMLV